MDHSSIPLLFGLREFTSDVIYQSLVISVLLLLSALMAAAEISFFSLSPSDVKSLEEANTSASRRVLRIIEEPKKLLATVLIGSNLVNIAIVILFASLIDSILHFNPGQEIIRFLIDAIGVTFLLLVVCEVVPKVYANRNSRTVALFMAAPIQVLERVLRPLSWILLSGTSMIDRRFRLRSYNITVDELGHALELTMTQDKQATDEEKRILEGIVRFGNTAASQIMRSRMDMVAIDINSEFNELLDVVNQSGYSRIPVYEETLDKITGVLVAKDVLPYLNEKNNFEWQSLVRNAFYVPGNKKIDDLLMDFRNEKTHIAIVVNEYGGTLGIVTLEDVIEEIVGDITDEFDDEDITYTKIDDQNYVFEGKTHLTDIYKVLKIDGDEFEKRRGEADTLAGFLLEISGRFLNKNEKIQFEHYMFTVEAADKKRIKQVKITINDVMNDIESSLNVKTTLVLLPLFFLFTSCGEEAGVPRPPGYFRIELPPAEYDSIPKGQPFTFLKNSKAEFSNKSALVEEKNFTVLAYPKLKATYYLTYLTVDTNLAKLINDCHSLAYNHTGKADDIIPVKVSYPENKVYGLIYDFKGDAATPVQFYVTDSVANFLRGSLYFYTRPNYDSIKPALDYVRKDLDKALSTLEWRTSK